MATSAPNTTPDPRPTGDLEHLFRQKFAEAEVTPRAGLWEQLDHELLVEQNNTFRRRLSVHRWVAAACLLLLLSISGWAVLRQWHLAAPDIAGQRTTATGEASVAASRQTDPATGSLLGSGSVATQQEGVTGVATADQLATAGRTGTAAGASALPSDEYAAYAAIAASDNQASQAGRGNGLTGVQGYSSARAAANVGGGRYGSEFAGTMAAQLAGNYDAANGMGMQSWSGLAPRFANLRGGRLSARPDTLKASLLAVPQPAADALAATQEETQAPAKLWRRLRLGGSYAASSYNPNINFSRNDGRLMAGTADAVTNALRNYYQEDAETEYRRNLKAGLSQRVALTAAYSLNKHWTLVSGLEAAQHQASSATSYGFVDGRQVSRQVADLFSTSPSYRTTAFAPAATRKTSYRYRTVAIPVEIRYGSVKPGTSLYAKVGAAVGLLLGTRSELEGSPEATRVYSLTSSDSPYRQVQTSVRGGAGVRYQPANATWSVALGPTAELGLTTLNANPSQRLINQTRPYSVGMEASVEFGSAKAAAVNP